MDVVAGDDRNANHLWIRQAITWPGRAYSGGDEPWRLGPPKGKRFRKVAVSSPVFDRLRTELLSVFNAALRWPGDLPHVSGATASPRADARYVDQA
ncbi:MAG: hypothetical protein NVS3B26_21910 [Mycobacteriales bacterium]